MVKPGMGHKTNFLMTITGKVCLAGLFGALLVFGLTSINAVAQGGDAAEAEKETAAEGGEDAAAATSEGETAATTDGDAAEGAAAPSDAGDSGTPATTAQDTMTAGSYAVRLRDLEQRISELKEQIFRSKVRLSLLAETVLEGVVAGSQAVITHQNKMSSSFRLVKVTYALDGAPIFNRSDEGGSLADAEEFQVYFGSMVPGQHTLTINLEYRGHGFGIFSYLKGYRFKVRSTHTFTAPEGRAVTLHVVGYEKGGATAPLEERPAVRYVERVENKMSAEEAKKTEGE